MNKLIVATAYCSKDHAEATRLLKWIAELDTQVDHHLLLVADNAVPMETKKSIDALGKSVFASCETILVKAPAPVADNYHAPAAVMFEKGMGHIDSCYKWNWLWLEPDAVPLKSGWLDTLAEAYDRCPKRFMGSVTKTDGNGVPPTVFFGTGVYPNCAYSDLKKFCDGKQPFDIAFSDYVVSRAQNSNLFFHRFGSPKDPPTFRDVKLPTDGPNVGTIDIISKEAVLFHRNKDGTLIDLLTKQRQQVALQLLESLKDSPSIEGPEHCATEVAEPQKKKDYYERHKEAAKIV